ncbi:GNAT family N-acetyltransferase [Virgibacillus ndiopensis]|uniref:GNAT family N-acetyltransferase n=1 Tax=Virgibacillus ndiopensis TaxID=2004408 RepID=UPI00159BD62A|nr:GNAT family N-acetyltransferase [Virgibacillus ndiopensis]
MYKLIKGKDISINDAAAFIAQLNKYKAHHIGFCGTVTDEIINAINEDMTDVNFENCFVGAVEDGKLVGLIGLDIDFEDKSAELWGPFVDSLYDVRMALEMWGFIKEHILLSLERVVLFANKENKLAKSFAEKLQFEQKTDQYILTFSQEQLEHLPVKSKEELTEFDYDMFLNLHDNIFPATYYSGEEILKRISEMRKVFILKDKGHIAAYVYVEADPDFGGGSIEFIAIDPVYRGKGYAKTLLATAVEWLFTFESITKITLCVAVDNKSAIGLYRSIGFQIEHELYYYSKN